MGKKEREETAKKADPRRVAESGTLVRKRRSDDRNRGVRKFGHNRTGMAFVDREEGYYKPFPDEVDDRFDDEKEQSE